MRRLAAAVALVGAAVAALSLGGASADDAGKAYLIEFDNAFGLVEGGDLKVGGVRVGRTTGFRLHTAGERPTALVEVEITEPGFGDFRTDASCRIRPQSLIGEYFVDCQPGQARAKLAEGGTVPVERTEGTINIDLVNNILRRPYRERFRLILAELGTGLAGRPEDLSEVIRRAHPGLRDTSRTLRILGDQNRVIEDFLRDADGVVAELARRKRDVARWVTEAGETAEISASRREALAGQFARLPTFLRELEPTMASLGRLADEQVPTLADLRAAAPDLRTFFERIGPFAREALPSIRSLARTSRTGREALAESREEVAELRDLAEEAPRFAEPLSQFLLAIDDRDRWAYDPDPRAAETAPPAPDPTADAEGKGFTGMESLLNYPYWQTLAINQFDEIGRMLRVVAFESECGQYHTGAGARFEERQRGTADPEVVELFERCNAWLGPHQPGITAPDPTGDGSSVAARERRDRRRARRSGHVERGRRGPGEPEAPPVPGQRDPSAPRVVLPADLRELLDRVPRLIGGDGADAQSPRPAGDPRPLLDYLLAP